MHVLRCQITLHEPLFYATRETGRLYETGRYLHNYGLAYALGLTHAPYFVATHVPRYEEELLPVAQRAIYVTPGKPLVVNYQIATLKYGDERLHSEMVQGRLNTPSFGRIKELAPESSFVCYVLSAEKLQLPRWIRMGKWHSKAEVETKTVEASLTTRAYRAASPLNPLDVPAGVLKVFDIISMPPSSLVANARCEGEHYALEDGEGLPAGMAYTFPKT